MKNTIWFKSTTVLLVCIFISITLQVKAQAGPTAKAKSNIIWQKCLGGDRDDIASDVEQTADGGYIIAGYSRSNNGDITGHHGDTLPDYWVVKLSPVGNVQWEKSYGGSDNDEAFSVKQSPDGNYIVAGHSKSSDGDVTDHYFDGTVKYDLWVIKIDQTGTLMWSKSYGGNGTDGAYDLKITKDGGFILAGFSDSDDGDLANNALQGSGDYWIVKADANGVIQWDQTYFGTKVENQNELDFAHSIQQTSDSNYIVAGYCRSCDQHPNQENLWMLKIKSDGTGDTLWTHIYGGSGGDGSSAIIQTSSGNYVSIGNTHSHDGDAACNPSGKHEMWVIKTNSIGNKISSFPSCYGGTSEDEGYDILETADGDYLLAGDTKSTDGEISCNHGLRDMWIVKADSSDGHIVWQETLGGSNDDVINSEKLTSDGNLIVAGYTRSHETGDVYGHHGIDGTADFWVVKLKMSGIACSIPHNPNATGITCNAVTLNWDIQPCATGYRVQYRKQSSGLWTTTDVTANNITLSGLAESTNYKWRVLTKSIDADGNKVLSAYTAIKTFTTVNCRAANYSSPGDLSIYPNPCKGRFTVSMQLDASDNQTSTVEVINMLGQIVFTTNAETAGGLLNKEISLPGSPSSALYMVRIQLGDKVYMRPLVVE